MTTSEDEYIKIVNGEGYEKRQEIVKAWEIPREAKTKKRSGKRKKFNSCIFFISGNFPFLEVIPAQFIREFFAKSCQFFSFLLFNNKF